MRARRASQLQGWLFIGPALLFVAVFVLVPLGQLVYTSLTDRSLLGGGRFVGFDNYLRIWRDASFWRALQFTVVYTLVLTPILMGLGYRAGAAHPRQHAAQAPDAHDRVPARRHRPVELEPAVVLAARRAGRAVQQAARRSPPHQGADRLVRHRRSRLLGGGDFDHLEGRRLRHGVVRVGDPGDQHRYHRGRDHGRRRLLEPGSPHPPSADPRGSCC